MGMKLNKLLIIVFLVFSITLLISCTNNDTLDITPFLGDWYGGLIISYDSVEEACSKMNTYFIMEITPEGEACTTTIVDGKKNQEIICEPFALYPSLFEAYPENLFLTYSEDYGVSAHRYFLLDNNWLFTINGFYRSLDEMKSQCKNNVISSDCSSGFCRSANDKKFFVPETVEIPPENGIEYEDTLKQLFFEEISYEEAKSKIANLIKK